MVAGKDKGWAEMDSSEQLAAGKLGWDEEKWEEGESTAACETRWEAMTEAQRAAATSLGYDEGAWNAELEEMQEDDEAQGQPAPAPPAPAPAPEPAPVPAPASDGPSEEGWGSVGAAATAEFKLPAPSPAPATNTKLSASAPSFTGAPAAASRGGGTRGRATVHVTNLPYTADESELRDTLMAFGEVTRIQMKKGAAHVDFKNLSGARNAVAACHRMDWGGRSLGFAIVGDKQQQETHKQKQPGAGGAGGNLREKRDTRQAAAKALVQPPDPREPKPLSLMVTNLPLRMRSIELQGLFRGFSATDAEVMMEGKRSLGFGIVTFPSANQLDRALSDMDGFEVEENGKDRQLGVEVDTGRVPELPAALLQPSSSKPQKTKGKTAPEKDGKKSQAKPTRNTGGGSSSGNKDAAEGRQGKGGRRNDSTGRGSQSRAGGSTGRQPNPYQLDAVENFAVQADVGGGLSLSDRFHQLQLQNEARGRRGGGGDGKGRGRGGGRGRGRGRGTGGGRGGSEAGAPRGGRGDKDSSRSDSDGKKKKSKPKQKQKPKPKPKPSEVETEAQVEDSGPDSSTRTTYDIDAAAAADARALKSPQSAGAAAAAVGEPASPTFDSLQQKVDEAGKRVEAVIAQRAPGDGGDSAAAGGGGGGGGGDESS